MNTKTEKGYLNLSETIRELKEENDRLRKTIDGQRIKLSRYWDIIQRFLNREKDGGNQVLVKEIEELLKIQP